MNQIDNNKDVQFSLAEQFVMATQKLNVKFVATYANQRDELGYAVLDRESGVVTDIYGALEYADKPIETRILAGDHSYPVVVDKGVNYKLEDNHDLQVIKQRLQLWDTPEEAVMNAKKEKIIGVSLI